MINLCLDVGMLLTPNDKWFGCYRAYGNDKYGFHDDNQIAYKLEEKEKAVSYGKQYVLNGVDGTYAVLTDQGECLNGDDGEFDDGCVEGFTYNKKDIIFSIAKINGKIVENFANDSVGTKMDLSKEEPECYTLHTCLIKHLQTEVLEIKRCSAIDIDFLTNDGKEDEVQLNVTKNILTRAGKEELEELFDSLTKEFNTKSNRILSCTVVVSADTEEELIEMGY